MLIIRGGNVMFVLNACKGECANIYSEGIPTQIVKIIGIVIFAIKVVIPILLIIFGMLDLGKAIMAQKEDEIKKGQQTFLKRLLTAAIVFLVVILTQFVVNIVAGDDDTGVWACTKCIIDGE